MKIRTTVLLLFVSFLAGCGFRKNSIKLTKAAVTPKPVYLKVAGVECEDCVHAVLDIMISCDEVHSAEFFEQDYPEQNSSEQDNPEVDNTFENGQVKICLQPNSSLPVKYIQDLLESEGFVLSDIIV